MDSKPSNIRHEWPADADAAAMDLIGQLERLKKTAEQAGETVLAAQATALFDDYLTRYCDGKHAALEAALRRLPRSPRERLN